MPKKIKKLYKKINKSGLNFIQYLRLFFSKYSKTSINGTIVVASIILILFIKFLITYNTYSTEVTGFFNYMLFFINDLLILSFLGFLTYLIFFIKNKIIKSVLSIFNFLFFLIFVIDLFVINFFQSRLSILDLYGLMDWSDVSLMFSYIGILLIGFAIFLLIFFNAQRYSKNTNKKNLIFTVCLFIFSLSLFITKVSSSSDFRLQQNILSFNYDSIIEYLSPNNLLYIPNEKTNYEDYFNIIKGQNKKLNLILVFAESFSAADSARVGGLNNNFPYFDKIQSQGTTFTNVISNGCTSDNAHISILQGVEPRYSPTSKELKGYFKYRNYTDTLPLFFNKLGFNTIFLSSAGLEFLDQRSFLKNMQYKEIIGEEKFRKDRKYTFDSAPDYYLYNGAIDLISQQTGNFFLTLQTISSHTPYYTPYGNSSKDMFEYVDKNLYAFYSKLKRVGFFNNGVLIIISDHRKMQPLTKQEVNKFGKIAYAKILATVIGSGIKPDGFNNNIIQHIDFFHSIKDYRGSGYVQISSLYNDIFSNQINRNRGVTYCAYFDNKYGLITSSGEFSKFRNGGDIISGNQFYSYLNAYQKYQSNLFSGNLDILKNTVIIGHRGDPSTSPDSSLQGFFSAKQNGADGVEFDISYTSDDQNIVNHGPNLMGTDCESFGNISDYRLNYIKKNCLLKNGESIKTLEEVLTAIKGMFNYYFVEIKVYDPLKAEQQTLDAIKTVEKVGLQDKVIFISYDKTANYIIGSLKNIKAGWDGYHTGGIDIIPNFSHKYYLLEKGFVTQEVIQQSKDMNKELVVYTVNDIQELKKLYNIGIRMFMTDNITNIKKALYQVMDYK
ncbi:MAG: sulfatase-like hydrolase/transferase [Candidatus Absconditicoccaceae bacterium]